MITSFDRSKRRKSFCHRHFRHSECYRAICTETAFQSAVNRQVAGSNPARGAKYTSFIFKAFLTSGVSRSNIIDRRLWGLLWGVACDHRIIDVQFQGRDSRAARTGADMRVAAEHSRVHVTGELSNGLLRYSGVFRQPSDEGVARIIEPAADSSLLSSR